MDDEALSVDVLLMGMFLVSTLVKDLLTARNKDNDKELLQKVKSDVFTVVKEPKTSALVISTLLAQHVELLRSLEQNAPDLLKTITESE